MVIVVELGVVVDELWLVVLVVVVVFAELAVVVDAEAPSDITEMLLSTLLATNTSPLPES